MIIIIMLESKATVTLLLYLPIATIYMGLTRFVTVTVLYSVLLYQTK